MNGKAYIVYRPTRFLELMDVMRKYHITPKSVQFVHPNEQSNANMVLVEGIKYGKEAGFKMLPPLYVHDESGNYRPEVRDRKSTRLNSSHVSISYAVFCLKKKKI